MKIAVKKLSQLLQSSVEVPVFEYALPGEFVGACIVVHEVSYDDELDEAEYAVDIHVPDKPDADVADTPLCPDMETIEALADQVLPLLDDLWEQDFNGWARKRELLKEVNRHCLTISLTLQFN